MMNKKKRDGGPGKDGKRSGRTKGRGRRQDTCEKVLLGMMIFFCVVLFAALLHLFWLVYSERGNPEEQAPVLPVQILPVPEEISPIPEPVSPAESIPSTEPEEMYDPEDELPEYPFQAEEVTVEIPGIEREYTIAWVSDLHMICDLEAAKDVQEEYMETVLGRYEFFKTADGIYSKDLWPEIVKFLNCGKYDGVIFGGDMMDYCSEANLQVFLEGYQRLTAERIMYIRADHDYGFWYGGDAFYESDAHEAHARIDGNVFENNVMDFGGFLIVGINDSTQNMSYAQYDSLVDVLGRGKPVIIVTHVPYESLVDESLEELSMDFRKKIYYWGGGDYVPYGATEQYFEIVYSDYTSICQVLAGHLHKPWNGNITERVKQHIFTPAFEGTIGVIHIVPKEQE